MWEALLFGIVSVGLILSISWFAPIFSIRSFRSSFWQRFLLILTPIICFGFLWIALSCRASPDIRGDPVYVYVYFSAGVLAFLAAISCAGFLGFSFIDDALQKGNWGSGFALAGATLGFMLCYAGSNIGQGPGPAVVLFCSLLSVGALAILWLLLELFSSPSVSENITVEREYWAGLRLFLWLLSLGIVLGSSVAGNWNSAAAALMDLGRYGWPAIALFVFALVFERILVRKRVSGTKALLVSLAVGVFYVGSALAWVVGNR